MFAIIEIKILPQDDHSYDAWSILTSALAGELVLAGSPSYNELWNEPDLTGDKDCPGICLMLCTA